MLTILFSYVAGGTIPKYTYIEECDVTIMAKESFYPINWKNSWQLFNQGTNQEEMNAVIFFIELFIYKSTKFTPIHLHIFIINQQIKF